MISDPMIYVECDGDKCTAGVELDNFHVTYPDYTGTGGAFDLSDKAIQSQLEDEDWLWVSDDKQLCEDCGEEYKQKHID